jgi:flagellar motor switch protein FliM
MANHTNERELPAPWLREARVETTGPSIENMPRFAASLERFAETAGEGLAEIFGGAASGSIEATEATTTFSAFAAREGHPAALMRSEALDARMAMILDPRVVDIAVGAIFGIDSTDKVATPAIRPRTDLETRLIGELAKCLASALRDAFAPAAGFDLDFESLNTLVDANPLGARDMPAIAARYTVKTPGGAFGLTLVLPQSFTAPLAGTFARRPADGAATLDPNWTRRMERGVAQAHMTLTAILDEFEMTLGDVSALAVGRVLPLSGAGEGRIRIECAERGVFVCGFGERNSRYALEVEDIIARQADGLYPAASL